MLYRVPDNISIIISATNAHFEDGHIHLNSEYVQYESVHNMKASALLVSTSMSSTDLLSNVDVEGEQR